MIFRYTKNVDEVLPKCDVLVNHLPSTKITDGLLNNDKLKMCADRVG